MNTLRVLIVDDEPVIRQGIRDLLAEMAEIEVAGECETGAQAIEAIEARRLDLVLLDVQMPDCSGLDVVRRIGVERMPMVIFVTAYDEYAVAAFEINAADYLLKPFHGDRLRKSIERAR
jgi:two-component system LytT family response regulator